MNVARSLVVLAITAACLVPANADATVGRPTTATTTDTTHDVTYEIVNGDQVQPGGAAPQRAMGDLHVVKVTQSRTAVRFDTTFVELNRVGTDHLHVYQIKTPRQTYVVDLYATTGAWGGSAAIFGLNGSAPKCKMAWKINYTANTVMLSVPRSCLGNPAWIQAGAGMTSAYGHKRYADDGLTADPAGNNLTLGPKLYP